MTTKKQKENALRIESEHASYVAQKIYEEAEKKAREICEFITGDSPLTDYKVRITAIEHSDLKQICNAVSAPKAEMTAEKFEVIEPHKCDKCGKIYGLTNAEYKGIKIWQACDCHPKDLIYCINEESLLKEQTK